LIDVTEVDPKELLNLYENIVNDDNLAQEIRLSFIRLYTEPTTQVISCDSVAEILVKSLHAAEPKDEEDDYLSRLADAITACTSEEFSAALHKNLIERLSKDTSTIKIIRALDLAYISSTTEQDQEVVNVLQDLLPSLDSPTRILAIQTIADRYKRTQVQLSETFFTKYVQELKQDHLEECIDFIGQYVLNSVNYFDEVPSYLVDLEKLLIETLESERLTKTVLDSLDVFNTYATPLEKLVPVLVTCLKYDPDTVDENGEEEQDSARCVADIILYKITDSDKESREPTVTILKQILPSYLESPEKQYIALQCFRFVLRVDTESEYAKMFHKAIKGEAPFTSDINTRKMACLSARNSLESLELLNLDQQLYQDYIDLLSNEQLRNCVADTLTGLTFSRITNLRPYLQQIVDAIHETVPTIDDEFTYKQFTALLDYILHELTNHANNEAVTTSIPSWSRIMAQEFASRELPTLVEHWKSHTEMFSAPPTIISYLIDRAEQSVTVQVTPTIFALVKELINKPVSSEEEEDTPEVCHDEAHMLMAKIASKTPIDASMIEELGSVEYAIEQRESERAQEGESFYIISHLVQGETTHQLVLPKYDTILELLLKTLDDDSLHIKQENCLYTAMCEMIKRFGTRITPYTDRIFEKHDTMLDQYCYVMVVLYLSVVDFNTVITKHKNEFKQVFTRACDPDFYLRNVLEQVGFCLCKLVDLGCKEEGLIDTEAFIGFITKHFSLDNTSTEMLRAFGEALIKLGITSGEGVIATALSLGKSGLQGSLQKPRLTDITFN
jgi:hypothetical protein